MKEDNSELAHNEPQQQVQNHTEKKFTFNVTKPFSNPHRPKQKFLIDGLLKKGGLAALVAKPKQGKSSLARYAAVCITKGEPFLGSETIRGEVLLITIEDSTDHVENCLTVLGWNPNEDEAIHLIDTVSSKADENINALRGVLKDNPGIRLVIIDTFAKFGRVKDINEYSPWLKVFDPLKQLRADFPHVSFLCLLHAKKTTGDDFFDSMLGSSALRGEFDSSIALYRESGQRLITTECREGKAISPTILVAPTDVSEGCEIVTKFSLGQDFDSWSEQLKSSKDKKRKGTLEERIIQYLTDQPNDRAFYKIILEEVQGKTETKIEAIKQLIDDGVLKEEGKKGSDVAFYALTLDRNALQMRDFTSKFKREEAA